MTEDNNSSDKKTELQKKLKQIRTQKKKLSKKVQDLQQTKEDLSTKLEEEQVKNLNKNLNANTNKDEQKTRQSNKWYHFFTKYKGFSLIVLLPVIILFLYYMLLATPRYESKAIVALKQNKPSLSTSETGISTLLGGMPSTTSDDYLLIKYIQSQGMLKQVQNDLNLKKLYQTVNADFISRLPKHPDKKTFLEYYKDMIAAYYDTEAMMITLSAQAFSPEAAHKILQNIVKNSQEAVDNISHTLAKNRMSFSQKQLKLIRKKALNTQKKLLEFQNKHGMVDPESSVKSINTIINKMKSQLSSKEAELSAKQSYLNNNAPQIQALKQKIKALEQQIKTEKQELISLEHGETDKNNKQLNEISVNYQWLKLKAEFAMSEYKAALQSYEMAKMDSLRQQKYLVKVMSPTKPEIPSYPKMWYNLLTLLLILLAIYGIGRMVTTIIIEHRY